MPAIRKFTLIFGFEPDPLAWGVEAPGRAGGWSESYWITQPTTRQQRQIWAEQRAGMLATDCAVIGYRETPYIYNGNKLIPGHATVGTIINGGALAAGTNSPDDALRIRATAGAVPVSWFLWLHAVPDDCIQSGQFTPSNEYKNALQVYLTSLTGQGLIGQQIQWLGRDPTKVSQRVLSVDPQLQHITTQVTLGAVAGQDFIRLRRVYDDNNIPIQGTYFVVAVVNNANGSVTYTVQGLPAQTRTTPSGTARVDSISSSNCTFCEVSSLGERKVGRPTSLRRGRRTKVRR
jgi:hypothetical protein